MFDLYQILNISVSKMCAGKVLGNNNWPAMRSVKVSDDFIVKQNCQGTGSARAFSIWIKLSLRINNGTIKLRREAN